MSGGTALGAVVGGLMDAGNGAINTNQNKKAQERTFSMQKDLNQQGKDLALQQWKDTNYSAQRRELEKAGLNVGLMYEGGGAGGQTAVGSGGSAPSQAPASFDIGKNAGTGAAMGAQLALMKAQKDNVEANTNKTNIEASNIEEPTRVGIEKSKTEQTATELQNEKNRDTLGEQKEQIASESVKARNEAQVSTSTMSDAVSYIKANAIGRILENTLTEARTGASLQEVANMKQVVRKLQADISQGWEKLSQSEREVKIKQIEAELKAMYPNLGQVWGGKINEAMRDIDEIRGEGGGNYHGQKK